MNSDGSDEICLNLHCIFSNTIGTFSHEVAQISLISLINNCLTVKDMSWKTTCRMPVNYMNYITDLINES